MRPRALTSGFRLVLLVAFAVALMVIGYALGRLLGPRPDADLIQPGTIVELRLETGDRLVGGYAGSSNGYILLSAPASVLTSADDASLEVRALARSELPVSGDVLINRTHVVLVAGVAEGSDIEQRYRDAIGATTNGPRPSPNS